MPWTPPDHQQGRPGHFWRLVGGGPSVLAHAAEDQLPGMVVEGYYIVEAIVYLLHQVTGVRERELMFPVMFCLLVQSGTENEVPE